MKQNEEEVYPNLQDKRKKLDSKFNPGDLVRTSDIKRVFSKGDSTNYSYKKYTRTEVFHDPIPTYRINSLPERFNENLLLPTEISHEQKNKVMKEINFFQ